MFFQLSQQNNCVVNPKTFAGFSVQLAIKNVLMYFSAKKLVTKKKQSSLGKAINATNKFALCIARCFTHPKESWVGFKEGWHHFVDTLKHHGEIFSKSLKHTVNVWKRQEDIQIQPRKKRELIQWLFSNSIIQLRKKSSNKRLKIKETECLLDRELNQMIQNF